MLFSSKQQNGSNMSNEESSASFDESGEMQPEYDFSEGVRGKHRLAYHSGYTVHIHRADGSIVEEEHVPPPRTVVLDPDVFAYFPDSESVNRALRALIEIVPNAACSRKVSLLARPVDDHAVLLEHALHPAVELGQCLRRRGALIGQRLLVGANVHIINAIFLQ